jgi:hypothetical protein
MIDLRCMSFTSKGTLEIIVAGLQDTMLVIDLFKGDVIKTVRSPRHRDPHSTDCCTSGSYRVSLHEHEAGAVYMRCY